MPVLSKEKKKEIYKKMSERERNFLLEYMLNKYSVDIHDNRDGENIDIPSKIVVLVKSKTGKIIYQSIIEE